MKFIKYIAILLILIALAGIVLFLFDLRFRKAQEKKATAYLEALERETTALMEKIKIMGRDEKIRAVKEFYAATYAKNSAFVEKMHTEQVEFTKTLMGGAAMPQFAIDKKIESAEREYQKSKFLRNKSNAEAMALLNKLSADASINGAKLDEMLRDMVQPQSKQ